VLPSTNDNNIQNCEEIDGDTETVGELNEKGRHINRFEKTSYSKSDRTTDEGIKTTSEMNPHHLQMILVCSN